MGSSWEAFGRTEANYWTILGGIVSLYDVYVGFFLFIGWICYRENCQGIILAWSIVILLGGNIVKGLYAVIALFRSKGDPKLIFLGEGTDCSSKTKEA